jgi:hypothetical protein
MSIVDLGVTPGVPFESERIKRQAPIYVLCAAIFLLAFGVRIGLLLATQSYLSIEHSEIVNISVSLAQGRGFANAFGETGPTAHASPLYPLLLSEVYRCLGTGLAGEIGQEVLGCCLAALTWSLIPLLAEICRLDRKLGIAAALAGAVLLVNRWTDTKGSSEAALAGLACVLTVIFHMKCWYAKDFSVRTSLLAGVLSGLAMLVSASLGAVIVGLLLTGALLFVYTLRWTYIRFVLITMAVLFLTLLPWALRNYYVLGGLVWTRSNFPLELMVSNNDDARPNLSENEVAGHKYHPLISPGARADLIRMGELAYQKKLKGEVIHWIASHPQQFAHLTMQRIYYFWFPAMKRPLQTDALAFLTLMSIPGLIFFVKHKQMIGYGLLTVWIAYPLVYYIVQAHPRYVYPVQWTMYFLSSQSMFLLYELYRGSRVGARPPQTVQGTR